MKHLTAADKEVASVIAKIVEQEVQTLDPTGKLAASPQFVSSLVELVYNQALTLGEDLESFANHAKRKTVQPEDVYMITRRNDVLTAVLEEFANGLNAEDKPDQKPKKENSPVPIQDSADEFDDGDDELFANV